MTIQKGDVGIVNGRQGVYVVADAAEDVEVLTLTDGSICWRWEFTPLAFAADEELAVAGVV